MHSLTSFRAYNKRLCCAVVFIAALGSSGQAASQAVGAIFEELTPPKLPELTRYGNRVWLDQGWDAEIMERFHFISQGSNAFPLPISWMIALERPASSVWAMPFGNKGRFMDDEYILRFGFVKGEVSENNPLGFPVGLTPVSFQTLPGISERSTALGLTCAACHTARLNYGNTEYLINGGPASTDLALVSEALAAALGQTFLSSKFPSFLSARFNRFAKAVLGDEAYNDTNILRLKNDLSNLMAELEAIPVNVDVVEGYARLDALNRIGNGVFGVNTGKIDNYAAPNAPVNYPHIWTSSWFNWVQYDASIMGPLIRNAGEATGLGGYVNVSAASDQQRFSSSIPMDSLYWIESALSGDIPPYPDSKKFGGLQAPKWPDTFPPVNEVRAARGAELYQQKCKNCHLEPLNSAAIWSDEYFKPITYYINGEARQTRDALLDLKVLPLERIGTDPGQSNILAKRTINTAQDVSFQSGPASRSLGIDAEVCSWSPPPPPSASSQHGNGTNRRLENFSIEDGPMLNFGVALGGFVQMVVNQWFDENNISPEDRDAYKKFRPNCLQVGKGYKARPLNGIWATAPFLHNGSVPTIMDLLSPPDERPAFVVLGNVEFDAERLGIKQPEDASFQPGAKYNNEHFFILDTSVPGNSNQGHEFSDRWDPNKPHDDQLKGVIGAKYSLEQRQDIIEYLKTL